MDSFINSERSLAKKLGSSFANRAKMRLIRICVEDQSLLILSCIKKRHVDVVVWPCTRALPSLLTDFCLLLKTVLETVFESNDHRHPCSSHSWFHVLRVLGLEQQCCDEELQCSDGKFRRFLKIFPYFFFLMLNMFIPCVIKNGKLKHLHKIYFFLSFCLSLILGKLFSITVTLTHLQSFKLMILALAKMYQKCKCYTIWHRYFWYFGL